MAPRNHADKATRRLPGILKPSVSTDVRARVSPAYRSARTETETSTGNAASQTSSRGRYSPSSRGRIILEAGDDFDLPEELEVLRSTLVHPQRNNAANARILPARWELTPSLKLPKIDDETPLDRVAATLEHIGSYFILCSADRLVEDRSSFFANMMSINHTLDATLELDQDTLTNSVVVDALARVASCYEDFVEAWGSAVHRALLAKLVDLQEKLHFRIGHRRMTFHEIEFSLFASEVAAVSSCPALQALLTTFEGGPLLMSEDTAKALVDFNDHLLRTYQATRYDGEQMELWLLIWQSLKRAFVAFQRGGAPSSPTNTLRDRKFFENPVIRERLNHLIHAHEAACPRTIEKLVGDYCQYIHSCQVDPGNKYESLQRTQDSPLEIHTRNAVREFIRTGKFETSTLSKIHFAVARFNKINGGPVRIIRWRNLRDTGKWETVPLGPLSTISPVVANFSTRLSPRPLTPNSPDNAEDQSTEGPAKRIFPHPEGLNIRSDFDYVRYPFPETRAHEIAQSEQIHRELAEPGIHSDGPRPEHLLNRPPDRVRNTTDILDRNLGPLTWIHLRLKDVFAGRRRVRPLPQVKRPTFTTLPWRLDAKRSSVLQKPAVSDPDARIHKPASPNPTFRLRGGGPRPVNWLTGPNRRNYFDSTAFGRKMIEMSVRELRAKFGHDVHIDVVQISEILKQYGYKVEEVVQRYTAPGRGKSVGPALTQPAQAVGGPLDGAVAVDQDKRVQPVYGLFVGEDGEVSEYRVDNSPAGGAPSSAPIFDDDRSDYEDQENQTPPAPRGRERRPLGSLGSGDYPVASDHQGDGSLRIWSSPSQRSDHRQRCHPCPEYAGQYHHVCGELDCGRDWSPSPLPTSTSPTYPWDSPTPLPRGNNNPVGGSDNSEPRSSGNGHRGGGNGGQGQAGGQNNNGGQGGSPENGPAIHPDERTVESVISATDFEQELEHFIRTFLDRSAEDNSTAALVAHYAELPEAVAVLGNWYEALPGMGPGSYLEDIPDEDRRSKANMKAQPATQDLCQRALQDVDFYERQVEQYREYQHPRTILGFRIALNRLIIALREARLLLRECLARSEGGNEDEDEDEEDDDDEDEEGINFTSPPVLTDEELYPVLPPPSPSAQAPPPPPPPPAPKPTKAANKPPTGTPKKAPKIKLNLPKPTPSPLPLRADYENMFIPELRRELQTNRNIPDIEKVIDKKKILKADLIEKLMELDKAGNRGHGAVEGYRNITGLGKARGVPKDWDMEEALKEYYKKPGHKKP